MHDSRNWWEDGFYDDTAAMLFLERSVDQIKEEVDFLERYLQLAQGARVFDQCCGIGNLSTALAQRGYSVEAVDCIPQYIERARTDADIAGVSGACTFTTGDARVYEPPPPIDAAFNWYSSFGYSPDDYVNRTMLERAATTLRAGGTFALDIPHGAGVIRHFEPVIVKRRHSTDGEIVLRRDCQLDRDAGLLNQEWTYTFPDGSQSVRPSSLRLYSAEQIVAMLADCGFDDVEFFGGSDARSLTDDERRMIVVARKREN